MLDYPIIQLNVGWLSIFSLTITLFLYLGTPVTTMSAFNDMLIIDSFSSFIKILIVISSIVCCLMSLTYLENKKVNSFEYFILILLATIGMLCLVSTNDLLGLYMSIELMSLSFYILAAYKRNSEFSGEAAIAPFSGL